MGMETQATSPLEALKLAHGGNSGIARLLGDISPQAVSQWKDVPVERAIQLEDRAGIPRHKSRPDIWPAPERAA